MTADGIQVRTGAHNSDLSAAKLSEISRNIES